MMTNPLLQTEHLPAFSLIQPEHVVPAIDAILAEASTLIEALELSDAIPTWDNFVAPLQTLSEKVSQVWSPVSHLNSVKNTELLRKPYEEALQKLTEYETQYRQNKTLYERIESVVASETFEQLSLAQKQYLRNEVREFQLRGVHFEGEKQQRFAEIQQSLSALSSQFSNNVLDATRGWYFHSDSEETLAGLPNFAVQAAKQEAESRSLDGYVLTLDGPVYLNVMTYASNRDLRKAFYEAYVTRASAEGPNGGQWDNSGIIDEIMSLRMEKAALLGFADYATLSLERKMAESPAQVEQFIIDLAEKSRVFAESDLESLKHFAKQHHQFEGVEPWDIAYFSEKQKLHEHAISDEQLRPYFPVNAVLAGLFRVANTLFDVDFRIRDGVEVWHEGIVYYEVLKDEVVIAGFYLDLYARDKKRGGAWMGVCRSRCETPEGVQDPVAYLVCNFNPPVKGVACLNHREVTTLFHEFGHGLHHMLTTVSVSGVSGISGVPWDAVELPSQFMENFCWQPEVLNFLSSHVETGDPLPDALLDNMLAAKNFHSGLFMLRQLEFALFDLQLHREFGTEPFEGLHALMQRVRETVAVIIPPAINQFQNSFSHIFAGGYAAGYYSYKWAEVLSADAFSAFEEEGILNPDCGKRFYQSILTQGGARDAMALFEDFRGRKPSIDALLRHSGLAEPVA